MPAHPGTPARHALTGPARLLRPGPARRAAEPLAWWSVLLAAYLALVSAITVTEITVGALAAAGSASASNPPP